jgi:DnaJ like chaperone protein
MGYTRWISGGLGWAFGGPIGGLIGFALGSVFESATNKQHSIGEGTGATTRGDFGLSFVVLTAAVMKADGKVLKSELDYVKTAFVKFFGVEQASDLITILRDVLKQDINLNQVTAQIKTNMNYDSRLQVLHFLYGTALSDGHIDESELRVIAQIAFGLGINDADASSIKNMYVEETDSAFKILEVSPDATEEEIKKAYKKMAIKYHPDKVSYLGPEAQKQAEEQFKKLAEAYEKIKKLRNIK